MLLLGPALALAPVTVPEMVPIVHVNVLETVAVRFILVLLPAQMLFVFAVVTEGVWFTTTETGLMS